MNDVKALLKVLLIFVPLPIFWALFDQQGSRWTFQATHMIGQVGSLTIKPDQMQVLNALLIVVFIPLFDLIIYPLLNLIGIKRPLQKLTLGMICAGVAFFVSGLLELEIQSKYPVVPTENEGQLRVFNGLDNCGYQVSSDFPNLQPFVVAPLEHVAFKHIPTTNRSTFNYKMIPAMNFSDCQPINGVFNVYPAESISYYIRKESKKVTVLEYKDFVGMPEKGYPLIRLLASINQAKEIQFKSIDDGFSKRIKSNSTELFEIPSGTYQLFIGDKNTSVETFTQGGVYTIVLTESTNNTYVSLTVVAFKYMILIRIILIDFK